MSGFGDFPKKGREKGREALSRVCAEEILEFWSDVSQPKRSMEPATWPSEGDVERPDRAGEGYTRGGGTAEGEDLAAGDA